MEKEPSTQFIAGATCAFCGVYFPQKFGHSTHNRVRNLTIPMETNTGVAYLKLRTCREHLFTDEDLQWLIECHKLYFNEYHQDAQGNTIAAPNVESWKLKVDNQEV